MKHHGLLHGPSADLPRPLLLGIDSPAEDVIRIEEFKQQAESQAKSVEWVPVPHRSAELSSPNALLSGAGPEPHRLLKRFRVFDHRQAEVIEQGARVCSPIFPEVSIAAQTVR